MKKRELGSTPQLSTPDYKLYRLDLFSLYIAISNQFIVGQKSYEVMTN